MRNSARADIRADKSRTADISTRIPASRDKNEHQYGKSNPLTTRVVISLRWISVWGPGLLVMLADADAGNVVTGAQAGARWGYRLLPLLLALIPMLYMVQELAARLGIHTGRGYSELVRERFGIRWAWLALASLAIASIGTLVTEFTAVAGIGQLYGLSRSLTLPSAAAALLLVVATGSYRRVERIAVFIGLFALAFFGMAWAARPNLEHLAADAVNLPLGDRNFLYLAAAIIGATFNPWMIFYQQSAVVEKKLLATDLGAARWDTAVGALLTQCLTGAVLIAAAATLASHGTAANINSIGEISAALSPLLGEEVGRLVFSAGVLGASLVAAIVSSLALAWGIGEVAGHGRSLEYRPFEAKWFYHAAACIIGAACLVAFVHDLVWLNIAAQVLNAFLLPVVIGLLIALGICALPERWRLRGLYLRILLGIAAIVIFVGLYGGVSGLF